MTDRVRQIHRDRLGVAILAVLAYLPALTAAPGRMPADSKLYLYLDPGRFLVDATATFDPRQFAGWVPHQHVSYLWPAGPWFWLFDLISLPDWVAHRLWIASLFLAAGLGARACAHRLGLGSGAAFAAAIVYQLSLYVLPYVSRTSVMLLPWAGLGWIVAFTIRATRRAADDAASDGARPRWVPWSDAAPVALVVFSVGSVNATALAMIAPAPVLWLLHERRRGVLTWPATMAVGARVATLSAGVSAWWIAMLVVQSRHGADVLPYSETLADVSLTATSPEVWRGLGYWLFYLRDPYAATTTESLRYLASTPAIAVSFLVPIAGLAGFVWTRWAHRRFAALLVVTGLVLAVGVHPIDDRSPLMRALTGGGDGGLALALRSSTRALPVMMLGVALGVGALVAATRPPRRPLATGLVAIVALANLPVLWTGALVDPALERDADPPVAWLAAAGSLDGGDARVLQLPGAEFGAYRWGYTVDQPLPGLTDRPVVTRDLLPLGSPAAMDLLLALDDRAQDGVLEPASIAPVARLLGVDTVWLTNDHAHERFRTARPEVVRSLVAAAPGVGDLLPFGEPGVNRPAVANTDERAVGDPRVGQPVVPVELAPIEPAGAVIRAATSTVVVAGDGAGLVDMAAAGLLPPGVLVRYAAGLDTGPDAGLDGSLDGSVAVVVTDSNRSRARHWRSSQDTRGLTEHGDPALDPVPRPASDQRLPVFDDRDGLRTLAEQVGPVRATATGYGEPFAYLPEHRPFHAIDGDPATAWLVGEHGDPVGERLVLVADRPIDHIDVRQPDSGGRRITTVDIVVTDADGRAHDLGRRTLVDPALSGDDRRIELGVAATRVEIEIAEVGGGEPFTAGAVAAVGFSEITHALGPSFEYVVPPAEALAAVAADHPLAIVLTRWRTDPMDRWRDDPEPVLRRSFELAEPRTVTITPTVRLDARASDAELSGVFDWPVVASSRLLGSPRNAGVAAFDGDPDTAWITAFDDAVGARLTVTTDPAGEPNDGDGGHGGDAPPIALIEVAQPIGGFSRVTHLVIRSADAARTVELVPDAAGRSTATVEPPLPTGGGTVEIEIAAIDAATTVDRRFGDPAELPAAISSIGFAGAPAVVPLADTRVDIGCTAVADLDHAPLDVAISIEDAGWLDGHPIAATPCRPSIAMAAGRHTLDPAPQPGPFQLDRLVLDDGAAAAIGARPQGAPTVAVRERSRFSRTVTVEPCPTGCWVVLGEGFNEAWSASVDGDDLGDPSLVDGGFNGWWLAPATAPTTIRFDWTAQRPLTVALVVSLLVVLAAAALSLLAARRAPPTTPTTPAGPAEPPPSPFWAGAPATGSPPAGWVVGVWAIAGGLLIGPWWAAIGAAVGAISWLARRRHLAELTALATVVTVAAATVFVERRDAPLPNGAWPAAFETLHDIGMFAAVALLAGALLDRAPDRAAAPAPVPDDGTEP